MELLIPAALAALLFAVFVWRPRRLRRADGTPDEAMRAEQERNLSDATYYRDRPHRRLTQPTSKE